MDSQARSGYLDLERSLVVEPDQAATTTARPTLEIVAPATLPEGYKFEAHVNDQTVTVTVPAGGVEEGQSFTVPMDGNVHTDRISIPTGQWRDGLCSWFVYGPCHPLVWNAWLFTLVANAQVMTRMKLTYLGKQGQISETSQTFKKTLIIISLYFSMELLLRFSELLIVGEIFPDEDYVFYENIDLDEMNSNFGPWYNTTVFLFQCLRFAYFTFVVLMIYRTRKVLREKFAIPNYLPFEDFLCAFCCSCCTVAQMARHTTNYDTYRGVCCSETGLPLNVVEVI